MKRTFFASIILFLSLVTSVQAQTVSGTVFPGVTQDKDPTWSTYVDVVQGHHTLEGWVGKDSAYGADYIYTNLHVHPFDLGAVFGGDNTGAHAGVSVHLKNAEVRLLGNTSGAFQTVLAYTQNLTSRVYAQVWLQPASDFSAYYFGVGYVVWK